MKTPEPTPRILLADADAFYAQVARLIDPAGAGRAELLLVGGSASGRGVVTSASYAAAPSGLENRAEILYADSVVSMILAWSRAIAPTIR